MTLIRSVPGLTPKIQSLRQFLQRLEWGRDKTALRWQAAFAVIDLAILWFMLTPVATVIVVAVSFWRLGDRRYALCSLVVLAILGTSIALALNR